MLNVLRRSVARRKAAEGLAAAILLRARDPRFYRELAVPDTFDGRFDLVTLHGWLALERLRAEADRGVSQALINALFDAFEDALRDQGAGDMGMSRRVKKIANAFYGRLQAYEKATGPEDLAEALLRNIYREEAARAGAARGLTSYVLAARARLAESELSGGELDFGPLPEEPIE